jgi:signal transduction histidine kinase
MVTGELGRARAVYPDADFDVTVERRPTVSANGMLSSAFRNLLDNAVDHHDGDHPTVAVTVGQDDDDAFVRVADDGPGIPDDRKEAVFGRGEQGLGSNGVGLGLYLVDRLVTQFGGEVELADSPSGGASFTVRLPVVSG